MTLDPDHVKIAITEGAGVDLDDAEAVAVARRLSGYCEAAAAYLDRIDADADSIGIAQALDAAAPRHG